MKEWEVGDPIGMGNDAGVPDIPYMGYLNNGRCDDDEPPEDHGYRDYGGYGRKNDDEREDAPKGPSFRDCLDKARKFSKAGNYSKALEYYDMALERLPHNRDALLEKATCLEKLGKRREAGMCYFESSRFDVYSSNEDEVMVAVKYLKKSIELDADNDEALSSLGYGLSRLKRYSEAISYYKRVTGKSVDWHIAQCYMRLNRYGEAIGFLENCLDESPLRGDWLCQKCECLFKVGRPDEAIAEFQSFIDYLVGWDCYYRAICMIDDLSKRIGDEDFFKDEKEEYMESKITLYKRLQSVLDAVSDYLRLNSNGLNRFEMEKRIEDDLEGFAKYISDKSAESIDDILKWYNMPFDGEFRFNGRCDMLVYKRIWVNLGQMRKEGKL